MATSDRWAELAGLVPDQPPPGSQLLRVQIRLDDADSRLVAARLWGLDELAARYRRVLAESGALTDQADRHAPGPAAFRAFADATMPIFDASAADPDLPDELLPPAWPRAAARELFIACYDLLGPLAARRVRQIIDRYSPELACRAAYHSTQLTVSAAEG